MLSKLFMKLLILLIIWKTVELSHLREEPNNSELSSMTKYCYYLNTVKLGILSNTLLNHIICSNTILFGHKIQP